MTSDSFSHEEPVPGRDLIAVALSGGVDSSVSAWLLQQQGFSIVGLFMNNWEDSSGFCTAQKDWEDVLAVANRLKIPCYSVNFSEEYQERVFSFFLEELRSGRTPNPDVLCNREIKFDLLLSKAQSLGCRFLATGHYCRKEWSQDHWQMVCGSDEDKDQSYFLHLITQKALAAALFPIGDLKKSAVRALARQAGLPIAEKRDSTGICFIGKRNFRQFIQEFIPSSPGEIVDQTGTILGQHAGLTYYTIGQRHGLHLGGKEVPWFVVRKELETNRLVVASGEDSLLFSREVVIDSLQWISDSDIPSDKELYTAKVRYRQQPQPCSWLSNGTNGTAFFQNAQRAVTPGQSLVLYRGNCCLGGGRIISSS